MAKCTKKEPGSYVTSLLVMLCAQSHKTFLVPYIPVDIICPRLWPRCIFFQLVLSHCSVFHFQGWVSSTNSREEVPNGSGPVGGDAIPHSIGVESSLWASRHQGREGQRDREGQLPCLSIQTWPVWWFSVLLRRRRKRRFLSSQIFLFLFLFFGM